MSDIDISPLAKRLADENNVDWRTLRGTGDDGRVVERDVLDYLARVMAGDEDLDPTPEPLPAGMESWSDQETFSGGDSSWGSNAGDGGSVSDGADTLWADPEDELLDQDVPAETPEAAGGDGIDRSDSGIEADTGWYTETGGMGNQPGDTESDLAKAEPAFDLDSETGSDSETDIDEDIFVFDDEPTGRSTQAEGADDAGSWADDVAGFGERTGESEGSDFAGDDFFSLDSEEPSEPRTGDGREFSWDEPEQAEPEPTGFESTGFESRESTPTEPTPTETDFAEPEPDVTPWEEQRAYGDTYGTTEPGTPWEAAAPGGEEAPDEVQDEVQDEVRPAQEVDSDAFGADAPWDGAGAGYGASFTSPSEPADFAGPLPEGVSLEETETRVADSAAAAADAPQPADRAPAVTLPPAQTQPPATAPVTRMRGFSGSGIVLRRDVDLSALRQAQQAVSQELGLAEVMAPASFLLRAAARAGRPWPLTTADAAPSLAMLTDDGVAVTHLPRASDMPFRELVVACSAAAGDEDAEASALVVADLSVLGIDEAVLDLGRPVLSLGRILPQEAGDRYRGTLALSGPVAPDAGSRFLARVVELLAAPVRLVL